MDKNANHVPLVFWRNVPMEKSSIWGAITGGSIGLWKSLLFLLQVNPTFSTKLLQAVIIAGAGAFAGAIAGGAGKWIWNFFKSKFIKPK